MLSRDAIAESERSDSCRLNDVRVEIHRHIPRHLQSSKLKNLLGHDQTWERRRIGEEARPITDADRVELICEELFQGNACVHIESG